MRRLLGISLFVFGMISIVQVAYAADPRIAYNSSAAATNWQGFYIGAQGDYLGGRTKYPASPDTPQQSYSGALGGIQAGYNWQSGPVVFGLEADLAFGSVDDLVHDGTFLTESGKLSSLGSVRARLGYSFGNLLLYGTGGPAWARLEQGTSCPSGATFGVCAVTGPFNVSVKETLSGWLFGGGAEYAFDSHWSLKGEILFSSFNTKTYTSTVQNGFSLLMGRAVPGGSITASVPVDLDLDYVAKVGINYRF